MSPSVTARIHLDALRSNLTALRQRIPPGTRLCPAVKANAYGHGLPLLLPVLAESGVEALCVAQLQEAIELRRLGWRRPVLCLGAPLVGDNPADCLERASEAILHAVECTVTTREELDSVVAASHRLQRPARVQVKVDTGMGRMGLRPDSVLDLIADARSRPELSVAGVYTHFAAADETDLAFAQQQLSTFVALAADVRRLCPEALLHASNSAAIYRLPGAALEMVRPGLGLYGYWAGPIEERPRDLAPILSVESRIVAVRALSAGESVGYGRTFVAKRDSRIGVIPVGYADGYRRALSNQGVVTVEVRRGAARCVVPVAGRVSMDQISVDLTDVRDVQAGDRVTLMDCAVDAPNSVEAVARMMGTIPYEVTCGLGQRILREAAPGAR